MRSSTVAAAHLPRSRILLLAAGPVLGATVGTITNVLTSNWNWWLFGALTALVGAAAIVAVILGVQTSVTGEPKDLALARQRRSLWKRQRTTINTLPRGIQDFTGRKEIVSRLIAAIEGTQVPSRQQVTMYSIEGMGGVGKTSLAVHVAHRAAQGNFEAVLFIDLRAHVAGKKPLSTREALGILLADLGVPGESIPEQLEGRASLWRRELTDARILVILDNVSGPDQVKDLLAGGPNGRFLLTSRRRLVELEDVSSISLDTLSQNEAATFFERVVGEERVGAQATEVSDVVRHLGYLPLAIRLAGARLRAHPTWAVNDLLKEDISHKGGLESVYNLSFKDLTSRQKKFFRLLSIYPGIDITAETAAVLAGTSRHESVEILDELYSRYLIEEPLPHRFKLHDLIKEFANQEVSAMNNDSVNREALLRLLSYYTFTASAASRLIGTHDVFDVVSPDNDEVIPSPVNEIEALAWLDAEMGNLLACAHYANDKELLPFAWQLPASLMSYLRLRGFLMMQAVPLLDRALHTLTRTEGRVGEGIIRRRIGHASRLQGNFESSRNQLEKSLGLSEELGDRQAVAWCHHELGHLDRVTNRHATARGHLTTAIAIHRELGNRIGVMTSETGLAIVLRSDGEMATAREYLRDAIIIATETGDSRAQAFALFQLGALERDTGEYEGARRLLIEALSIYDAVSNRAGQADCHLNLAMIDRLAGRNEPARGHLAQALRIYVDLGYRRGEADTYSEFAATAERVGDVAMSAVHQERANSIYAELGLRHP